MHDILITMRTVLSAPDLHWDDLLGRDTQDHGLATLSRLFEGKRVLVTGGAGYIGTALARAILLNNPQKLILLDASEHGIYRVEQQLTPSEAAITSCVLGNVLSAPLLNRVFDEHRPDIVFHSAALKHVPLLERHPLAAIETNVLGTLQVIRSAAEHDCDQCVLVSTDKAADPVSILGASKRIAELVAIAIRGGVTGKAVRLGNVLGSSGSVVPLFAQQIARNEAVTVTHQSAERYFMTPDEAAASLCAVASPLYGNGVYIPAIGNPIRVLTLAEYMIARLGKEKDGPGVVMSGLRAGDKLCEVMVGQDERVREISGLDRAGICLHSVQSPLINSETLCEAMHVIQEAVRRGEADAALRAVSTLVPSYASSTQIATRANG